MAHFGDSSIMWQGDSHPSRNELHFSRTIVGSGISEGSVDGCGVDSFLHESHVFSKRMQVLPMSLHAKLSACLPRTHPPPSVS
jgi:hypothetical protein